MMRELEAKRKKNNAILLLGNKNANNTTRQRNVHFEKA
jgi:hypothetical protein